MPGLRWQGGVQLPPGMQLAVRARRLARPAHSAAGRDLGRGRPRLLPQAKGEGALDAQAIGHRLGIELVHQAEFTPLPFDDGGQWEDLGQIADAPRPTSARYRASEQTIEIEGRTYRAVVVHSDHLEARKRETFAKRLAAQRQALEKALAALARERFTCAADAETAAGSFLQRAEQGPFPVQLDVATVMRQLPSGRRGRPRKDELPKRVREFVIHSLP